jgi:ABC-type branched-subunit amino acid transport system substrate-binding protein
VRHLSALTALAVLAFCCGTTNAIMSDAASGATSSSPIVVGGNGDTSISTGIAQGFEAGIYRFNKAGGLDGRKIKFLGFLDDSFSPATNLANDQQLVQRDHVMAIVPVSSAIAGGASSTFLADNKVPFIGWATGVDFPAEPKWGFGINGGHANPADQNLNPIVDMLAATGNTKTPGKVKVAFIANDYAAGIAANEDEVKTAKYAGMDVVYQQGPIPAIGATTYAPYAQGIISSGANAVFETLGSADSIGLAAALKADGFKGSIFNGVTYTPGQLANQPNAEGALSGVYVDEQFPANENKTPAVKQAEKDLVAIGQPPELTSGVSVGYWSAIVFEQMLRATLEKVGGNPNKVTGASLQKSVTEGFTYKDPIAGGIGTEYFPAAATIPTGCGTLLKVVGADYKQILSYQCSGAVNVVSKKKLSQQTGKSIG